jgi:hypothetical protein
MAAEERWSLRALYDIMRTHERKPRVWKETIDTYSISNDDVEATKMLDRLLNHVLAVLQHTTVPLYHDRLHAIFFLDFLGELLGWLGSREVVNGDVTAFRCKLLADQCSKATSLTCQFYQIRGWQRL